MFLEFQLFKRGIKFFPKATGRPGIDSSWPFPDDGKRFQTSLGARLMGGKPTGKEWWAVLSFLLDDGKRFQTSLGARLMGGKPTGKEWWAVLSFLLDAGKCSQAS